MRSRHYIAFTITLLCGIIFAFYLHASQEPLLMYREQQQIFLWDGDYVAGLLSQTGGFATLASQFLVQFFHLPWAGAVITALLASLTGFLLWMAFSRILGNSIILTFLLGILFVTGGYVFMDRILTMFGASAETIGYAREYMDIVLPGMFMTTVTFNLVGLIRASGYPTKSMWILVGGAVLNIILDALFIYGLDWGIAGAAWATTISMTCSAFVAVLHFLQPTSFIRFRRHAWRPKGYIFRNIILIGMSPFLMNVAASGVVALLNRQLIRYGGDLAVGAYGIVNTFASLSVMLMLGVCMGMQPIAGYNYGAGHPRRLKEVYTLTMKVNVAIGMLSAILALAIPQVLLRAFTKEQELINIAVPAMRFILVMFALVGFTITNSNFFQSIDKPWIAIVTSLSRQVLFLAPMIYLVPTIFVNEGGSGLTGVWASMTISDVLGTVLAFFLMLSQRKVFQHAE